MKEKQQENLHCILRVVLSNLVFSVFSLLLALVWASLWYVALYIVIGYDYPVRYDLENPIPYVVLSTLLFCGMGSCVLCYWQSRRLCECCIQSSKPLVQSHDSETDELTEFLGRKMPFKLFYWPPAGVRYKENPVFWSFITSLLFFWISCILQAFLYGGMVLGFWGTNEYVEIFGMTMN